MVSLNPIDDFSYDGQSFTKDAHFDCDDDRGAALVRLGFCTLVSGNLTPQMSPFVAQDLLRSLGINVVYEVLDAGPYVAVKDEPPPEEG